MRRAFARRIVYSPKREGELRRHADMQEFMSGYLDQAPRLELLHLVGCVTEEITIQLFIMLAE